MKKRMLSVLLTLVMVLSLMPTTVYADPENTPPAVCNDSEHEMGVDNAPNSIPNGRRLMAAQNGEEKTLSCAGFITNEKNQAYIDRMIAWYLDSEPALGQTLAKGQSVILFFEGGSDNVDDPRYADIKYRDGAVVIVLRSDDNGQPYIADYCENCNTLPDYPFGYEYDNGHTGYGTAVLIDGIYSLYTFNHKGTHAAFNTRTPDGKAFVPCVYMRDDGSFALLNGTGINVHARMRNTVSDSVYSPTSAGCITVGDNASLQEYNKFITTAVSDQFELKSTVYGQADSYLYVSDNQVKAGMMVMDRFLAKEHLVKVYGGNNEAVEYITAHSTACQCDTDHMLGEAVAYPAYQTVSVLDGTAVKQLPMDGAETLGSAAPEMTATALYDTGAGGYWYRVRFENQTGYLPAASVTDAVAKYDDLSIHNANWPTEKAYGNAFSVTGILGAVYNRYINVLGCIIDASGKVVSRASHTVGSGDTPIFTYSINGSDTANPYSTTLDYNLGFSGLALGEYRYQLTGTVKNYFVENGALVWEEKTVTMIDKCFTVVPPAITKGAESEWILGSTSALSFQTNINNNRFVGVAVDGQTLGTTAYISNGGNPVSVTLSAEMLAELTPGEHKLTVLGKYGNADAAFHVICKHEDCRIKDMVASTYTAKGTKTWICTRCGETRTETIAMKTLAKPSVRVSNTTTGIKISWNTVTGATAYQVYRKKGSGAWNPLKTTASTSLTNTSVTSGTKYQYKVRAIAQADGKTMNTGAYSSTMTIYCLARPTISGLSNGNTGIIVKWTKVAGATGYYIYRNGNKVKTITSGDTTRWGNTNRTNGSKYQYKVKAYKTVGDNTYVSADSAVKTKYFVSHPNISSATNVATRKIVVKWNKNSSASGYQVKYVKGSTSKTLTVKGASTLSRTISSLTKGSTYKVYVRAYKTVSNTTYYSVWSTGRSVKVAK